MADRDSTDRRGEDQSATTTNHAGHVHQCGCDTCLARCEALAALTLWRALNAARDGLIRDALAVGCTRADVAAAAGLNRSYLYDIVPVSEISDGNRDQYPSHYPAIQDRRDR